MHIHFLRGGKKTLTHAGGTNIAVDTSEHLPTTTEKETSADDIPELLKLENMKIVKVNPIEKKVKKYIHF